MEQLAPLKPLPTVPLILATFLVVDRVELGTPLNVARTPLDVRRPVREAPIHLEQVVAIMVMLVAMVVLIGLLNVLSTVPFVFPVKVLAPFSMLPVPSIPLVTFPKVGPVVMKLSIVLPTSELVAPAAMLSLPNVPRHLITCSAPLIRLAPIAP